MAHRVYQTEWLRFHTDLVGTASATDSGWTLTPSDKHLEVSALQDQYFPTRQALMDAIAVCYGPERIAAMEAEEQGIRDREAKAMATARQEAIARSFTGEKFDEYRPLKEVVKDIYHDLLAAMVAGMIPPDRYRVTLRTQRKWYDRTTIMIYTWHHPGDDELGRTLKRITDAYKRCEAQPRSMYDGDYGDPDRWHFRARTEWPQPWDRRKHPDATYEDYIAASEQAKAAAEAWGRAYIAQEKRR